MGIVSYAQNLEDVMLWRALGNVTDGFYIDVGAADPDQDSVTRAFYERGWHGINMEPEPGHYARLCAARPRDITLPIAAADQAGERTFYAAAGSGLSTLEPDLAREAGQGGWPVQAVTVQATTLAAVCEAHAAGHDIHFLKIDVEGAEEAALRGADFDRFRPWIILVEATRPGSQTPSHAAWEPILLAADYRFAWFDGLNRFYVAEERWEALDPHFQVQPNLFDGHVRAIDEQAQAAREQQAVASARAEGQARAEAAEHAAAASVAAAVRAVEEAGTRAGAATQRAEAAEQRALAAEARAVAAEAASAQALQELERDRASRVLAKGERARLFHAEGRSRALHAETVRLTRENGQLSASLHAYIAHSQRLETSLAEATRQVAELDHKLFAAQSLLDAIYASHSWRLSAPVRGVGGLARRALGRQPVPRLQLAPRPATRIAAAPAPDGLPAAPAGAAPPAPASIPAPAPAPALPDAGEASADEIAALRRILAFA